MPFLQCEGDGRFRFNNQITVIVQAKFEAMTPLDFRGVSGRINELIVNSQNDVTLLVV